MQKRRPRDIIELNINIVFALKTMKKKRTILVVTNMWGVKVTCGKEKKVIVIKLTINQIDDNGHDIFAVKKTNSYIVVRVR